MKPHGGLSLLAALLMELMADGGSLLSSIFLSTCTSDFYLFYDLHLILTTVVQSLTGYSDIFLEFFVNCAR